MSWQRQLRNWEARERDKRQHSSARWALQRYRSNGDTSGFPDLKKWATRRSQEPDLNLSGYRDDDVNPRLTIEEYLRFETAYEASDAGKKAKAEFEEWIKKIRES